MRYIADLHIHSKYSRATSKNCDLENLDKWAKIKGIDILATGDFTHPAWFSEIQNKLKPLDNGFFILKNPIDSAEKRVNFILSTEISCIYSKNGKCYRIHIVVLAPNLEVVEKINNELSKIGNIKSDGRPILGLDAKKLTEIILNISPECMIIPAHIWTPWFSLFGSKSGFNSIEECFEDYSKYIYAGETGLSSNPAMNWRWSHLDKITLISNSDAHSPENLGREANVFDFEKPSYQELIKAIKNGSVLQRQSAPSRPRLSAPVPLDNGVNPRQSVSSCQCQSVSNQCKSAFLYTIEFFPEEGKYHLDGHRACDVCLTPAETKKNKGLCPVCKKPLTIGVLNRVEELADRPENFVPQNKVGFKSLVPLKEIIADVFNCGKNTKKVNLEYESLIKKGGSEFKILLDISFEELKSATSLEIAEAIVKIRNGQVIKEAGYDGVYGKIKIIKGNQKIKKQEKLF